MWNEDGPGRPEIPYPKEGLCNTGVEEFLKHLKWILTSLYCTNDIPDLRVPLLSSGELPASRNSSRSFQETGTFFTFVHLMNVHAPLWWAILRKRYDIFGSTCVILRKLLWRGLLCSKVYKIHFQFFSRMHRTLFQIHDYLSSSSML